MWNVNTLSCKVCCPFWVWSGVVVWYVTDQVTSYLISLCYISSFIRRSPSPASVVVPHIWDSTESRSVWVVLEVVSESDIELNWTLIDPLELLFLLETFNKASSLVEKRRPLTCSFIQSRLTDKWETIEIYTVIIINMFYMTIREIYTIY